VGFKALPSYFLRRKLMKLNDAGTEYQLELNDVVNETDISSDDLGLIFGDIAKGLRIISHAVYRLIYDYYPGLYKNDHIVYMRTKISNNLYEEQTFLKNAMLEAVKGAVHSGMDLNVYIDDAKNMFPATTYAELRAGRLLDRSRKPNAS